MKTLKRIVLIIIGILLPITALASAQCNDTLANRLERSQQIKKFDDSIYHLFVERFRMSHDTVWLSLSKNDSVQKKFMFENWDIHYVSDSIFTHPHLTSIIIYNTPYFNKPEIQKKLFGVKNLNFLVIEKNWKTDIDSSIVNSHNLDTLIIYDNRIDTLHDWLFNVTQLNTFIWACNHTTLITNHNTGSIHLQKIDFREPFIYELPKFLYRMNDLKTLIMELGDGANYQGFDSVMNSNPNIEVINIANTEFQCLPSSICSLINLNELLFSHGRLKRIPPEIGNLKKLKILSIENNQITALPSEIENLKDNLEELFIRGNPITKEEIQKIQGWLPKTRIWFDE